MKSVDDAYKFEKDIGGSELIIYDRAGHLPMEELPHQSVADTSNFLKKNFKLKNVIEAELTVSE